MVVCPKQLTHITDMKNLLYLTGAVVASSLSSQAAVVYSTDFSGTYSDTTGASVLGGATPNLTISGGATNWFGSSNQVGVAGGDLSFSNTTANRYRGSGVWLDTSATGWEAGLVTVEFDVTAFTSGTDTSFIFQAYAANGVDASNSVSLDLHGGASAGSSPTSTGTATISALGTEQTITMAGTDQTVTFNFNGTDDFIALTFIQVNTLGGTNFGSADLDNLSVAVPEPGTFALLAGLTGLVFVMLRRRRA